MTKPPVRWTDVDWVLLDMDGTLLDLAYDNHFWREALPAALAEARGWSVEAAIAWLRPHFEQLAHTLPWYCTDHWTRLTGINIAALKRELKHRIAMLDGSREFLERVRASGRRIWLATNAHRDSWQLKLEVTALHDCFDGVLSSHDVGFPKETAAFWRAAQAHIGFDPARTLFADDSRPVLEAARDYGIAQVLAMSHPDTTQAPRQIEDFPSVARLMETLPIALD